MAHIGRRAEVYWPPEGSDAEGTWYKGQLDRYDSGTGVDGETGGGYHVTYDDGDEETLGEIDGRDDVRLLEGDNRRSEEGNGSYEQLIMDGAPAMQQDGVRGYSRPEEIPRAETILHPYDEDSSDEGSPLEKLSGQPLGQFPGGGSSSGPYEVHKADSGIGREPKRVVGAALPGSLDAGDGCGDLTRDEGSGSYGGSVAGSRSPVEMACGNLVDLSCREIERSTPPCEAPGEDTGRHRCFKGTGGGSGTGSYGENAEGPTVGNRPNHDNDRDEHNDRRDRGNGFMPARASTNHENSSSTAWACSDDDSDDDRLFGTGNGRGKSSYRYGAASPGGGGDGILSLSSGSSNWTPLQGSEFVRSPSQQQPWDRSANSDDGNVSARDENAATDGIISALRAAVDTSSRESIYPSKGGVESVPDRRGEARGSHRGGVSFAGGLGVCEAREGCGSAGLKAFGKIAHDTALLEGAVEGVEGQVEGGIFVKVSFIDGGGGDVSSFATNAMFRCKTLLHTTGSGTANRGDMGWNRGEFRCEAFHGGRLEELANAGVLFSAHRGDIGKSRGKRDCKATVKDRDGFLGQVG